MGKLRGLFIMLVLALFVAHFPGCASGDNKATVLPEGTTSESQTTPEKSYNTGNGIPVGYTFPAEWVKHKATWLAWPHKDTYGEKHRNSIEHVWIEMTRELRIGEEVHILVQDQAREDRAKKILTENNVSLENVFFHQIKTDDVWMRDMGPCFVSDGNGNLAIVDWQFDGWGGDTSYEIDQHVDKEIAKLLNIPIYKADIVMEGGAIDVNGAGVLLTTESVALHNKRNPGLSKEQASDILRKYYGQEHIIMVPGIPYEISEDMTDGHIDGWAKFINENEIITGYWGVNKVDREIDKNIVLLRKALEQKGLPIKVTASDYIDTNYYEGNEVIIYPWTNGDDEWYKRMEKVLEELYPDKRVVGIDCTVLYDWGGAIHCVTQQQPLN